MEGKSRDVYERIEEPAVRGINEFGSCPKTSSRRSQHKSNANWHRYLRPRQMSVLSRALSHRRHN